MLEQRFGALRTRAGGARRRRRAAEDAARGAAGAGRRSTRTATRCRWRSAGRCARRAIPTSAIARVRARRGAGADGHRRRQPARADRRRSRWRRRTHAARDRRAGGADGDRLRQRRGGARARRRCCARPTSPIRRRLAAGVRADRRRSIRSTPRRTRRSAAWRCSATTPTPPSREFRAVLALESGRPRRAPTPISPRAISRRGKRAEAKKQTLAALEIAPSYERAQDLLLKLVGGEAVIGRGAPPRAVRLAVAVAALIAAAAGRRRWLPSFSRSATRSCPAPPDDRFAGLQWRFVRIKYHYVTEGTRDRRRTSTASRGPSTRPAAEQNLSRRVKTATAIEVEDPIVLTLDDPRLFAVPVDLLRRAGQPAAARHRGARSCASSCCAAAR